MAISDLVGDIRTAYLTNEQRAALVAKGGVTTTGGPIAKASAGLAVAAPLAANMNTTQMPPANLADALNNPTQFVKPPQAGSPASLEAARPVGITPTPTSPTYPAQPQVDGQRTLGQLSAAAATAQPVTPPATQQAPSLASAGGGIGFNQSDLTRLDPSSFTPVNDQRGLDSAYRQTSPGSNIAGRVGANGVTEFSNAPADLRSAGGLPPINTNAPAGASLADAYTAPSTGAGFAALGSAANLGDGVGTFSQGQAGDSQLALTRFQRANDLRNAYQAQDSADLARTRANQGAQLGIVRDSSQRLTRSDLASAALEQQAQAGLVQNAARAQQSLEDLRTGQAAATQTRQAQRLEDAFNISQSPNATPEQLQAAQRVIDPDGSKALAKRQAEVGIAQTESKTQESQANAAKLTAEANGTTPEAQQKLAAAKDKAEIDRLEIERRKQELNGTVPGSALKQQEAANKAELDRLEIERRKTVAAQTAKTLADQKTGSIDVAKEARDLANSITKDSSFDSIVGPFDARTPTLSGSSQDLVNKANRLQSLLTLDNLKLMSGVLTDKDIEFLGRIGSGLNVTENGIKGSEAGTRKRLGDIASNLTKKITDYEKANPARPAPTAQQPALPAAVGGPIRVTSAADLQGLPSGTLFVAPDGKTKRIP